MNFEVEPTDIEELNSETLVELMRRLLLAECAKTGIPLRAATVSSQITVSDGGKDGEVKWQGGYNQTDYFPRRFNLFQSKANKNITNTQIKNEITKKGKDGVARLSDAMAEVIKRHGAYVLFCKDNLAPIRLATIYDLIIQSIESVGQSGKQIIIEIYDANKISDWANNFPNVVLWIREVLSKPVLHGLESIDGWAKDLRIHSTVWIEDDFPRYEPIGAKVEPGSRKSRNKNAWSLEQFKHQLNDALIQKRAIRITGASGFGKSNLVYNYLKETEGLVQKLRRNSLIFANYNVTKDAIIIAARNFANTEKDILLVVDECPDDTHIILADISKMKGSNLQLLTINIETNLETKRNLLSVKIRPANSTLISAIIDQIDGSIAERDKEFIIEIAHGFPMMASWAAKYGGDRKAAIDIQDFIDRIIWQGREKDKQAEKVIEFLSLFERIGCEDWSGNEVIYIASTLAKIDIADFYEHMRGFEKRGIVERRSGYVQVVPIPLAYKIANRKIENLPLSMLLSFIDGAPNNLKLSLVKRFQWLEESNSSRNILTRIITNSLQSYDDVISNSGSRLVEGCYPLIPDFIAEHLEALFAPVADSDLRKIGDNTSLLWTVSAIAARSQTFILGARLLRRIGANESASNNHASAKKRYRSLFSLNHGTTQADMKERFKHLEQGLNTNALSEKILTLESIGHILSLSGYPADYSFNQNKLRSPLKLWKPKDYDEAYHYVSLAIEILIKQCIPSSQLCECAKYSLSRYFRILIPQLGAAKVIEITSRVIEQSGVWYDAIYRLNEWLYFEQTRCADDDLQLIRPYYESIIPSDESEKVILFTKYRNHWLHNPDKPYKTDERDNHLEYALQNLKELAEKLGSDSLKTQSIIQLIVCSNNEMTFEFGNELALAVNKPHDLFFDAVKYAESSGCEPNISFIAGIIAGISKLSMTLVEACLAYAQEHHLLKAHIVYLTRVKPITKDDVTRICRLIESGACSPKECVSLSYGRMMEGLEVELISQVLYTLNQAGIEGKKSVIEMLNMIGHSDKNIISDYNDLIEELICNEPFELDTEHYWLYNLERVIEVYYISDDVSAAVAVTVAEKILEQAYGNNVRFDIQFDSTLVDILENQIRRFPRELWFIFAKYLEAREEVEYAYRVDGMFGSYTLGKLSGGVISKFPINILNEWVDINPATRAKLAMVWIPIVEQHADSKISWHPHFEQFVIRYASFDNMFEQASYRLHPNSWSGSYSETVTPILTLLQTWMNHPVDEIKIWAINQSEYLIKNIDSYDNPDYEED